MSRILIVFATVVHVIEHAIAVCYAHETDVFDFFFEKHKFISEFSKRYNIIMYSVRNLPIITRCPLRRSKTTSGCLFSINNIIITYYYDGVVK